MQYFPALDKGNEKAVPVIWSLFLPAESRRRGMTSMHLFPHVEWRSPARAGGGSFAPVTATVSKSTAQLSSAWRLLAGLTFQAAKPGCR